MEYSRPEVSTLNGTVDTQSTWLWTETVVAGVFVFVAAVVVSQIDITP